MCIRDRGYAETDKFKFGQTGIDSLYIKPVSLFSTDVYTGTKSAFPESRLGFIYPLKADENSQSYYETPASTWGGYAVSSSCTQVERVLQFIDWCYSKEGRTLMNLGVQGITYDSYTTTEDGTLAKINYKDDQYENSLKYVSKYFTFITALDGMRLVAVGDSPENQDAYINMETTYRNNVQMAYIPTIQVLTSYSCLLYTSLGQNGRCRYWSEHSSAGEYRGKGFRRMPQHHLFSTLHPRLRVNGVQW